MEARSERESEREREREREINNSTKLENYKGSLPEQCQLAVALGEGTNPEQRHYPRVRGTAQCKENIPGQALDHDKGNTPTQGKGYTSLFGLGQVKAIIGFFYTSP